MVFKWKCAKIGHAKITQTDRGVGTIFFLGGGGGKSVDMPSDCQIYGGGHRHIHPIETKGWGGAIAPLAPPPAPAPLQPDAFNYMSYHFLCNRGIRPARTEQFLVRFVLLLRIP